MPRDTTHGTTMTETRAPYASKAISVKAEDVRDDGTFAGYGSVFNVEDAGFDIVLPGAFAASLAEHRKAGSMPKLLWQHDPWEPIGIWTEMREDSRGLYCEGKLLTDIELGRKAHVLLKNRAIDGLSIGYDCQEWEIEEGEAAPPPAGGPMGAYWCGPQVRRLKKINLWEVSVVTFPMNTEARVSTVKRGAPEVPLGNRGLYRALDDVARIARQVNRAI
jgi:HK97 family phage prohead protease